MPDVQVQALSSPRRPRLRWQLQCWRPGLSSAIWEGLHGLPRVRSFLELKKVLIPVVFVLYIIRRSSQSVLKEIKSEYPSDLMLKLQYFGHLMQRTNSLEKTLMLERLRAGEERDGRG